LSEAVRRIVYVTGTRADFGLMRATLLAIDADPALSVLVLATGMHFSAAHGDTIREVEAAGLPIVGRVPVPVAPATGATMARGIGAMVTAFTDALQAASPDIVLLLGDRGEMLAGAIAALHLNIVVAHVHGGERSGTVDEPVRHAISKLSHLHLTATEEARARLVAMGEAPANIRVTGAPGVDGLTDGAPFNRAATMTGHGLDPAQPVGLVVYHPVLQVADRAGEEAAVVVDAVLECGMQALVLMPNADAGSDAVRAALETRRDRAGVALLTHLPRPDFIAAMATADVMVGNSSAGIIEAASFGTPVINIGSRQRLRERNANVIDVEAEPAAVRAAIGASLSAGRHPVANVYGDGHAAARIVAALRDAPIGQEMMMKTNAY
jgi:GDP/UDP-N,N'-diacetylbacillosamine 2-epimerase (hydrolysing)